jgi:hypothetical protein
MSPPFVAPNRVLGSPQLAHARSAGPVCACIAVPSCWELRDSTWQENGMTSSLQPGAGVESRAAPCAALNVASGALRAPATGEGAPAALLLRSAAVESTSARTTAANTSDNALRTSGRDAAPPISHRRTIDPEDLTACPRAAYLPPASPARRLIAQARHLPTRRAGWTWLIHDSRHPARQS